MYLFKLVKQALDVLYADATSEYDSSGSLESTVRDHLQLLSSSYGQLTAAGGDPIDYNDIAARIGYLFCYVAAHADHVRHALQLLRNERNCDLFDQSALRVTSIGSGPGTDVLGILKYLHESPTEPVTDIEARLFDRESAWKDARKALKRAYANHPAVANGDRLRLKTKTRSLDIHNGRPWTNQGNPHDADLITLSYFVSEAYSQNKETAARWLEELFSRVRSGTYILYVDNASQPITNYFDAIWQQFDLDLLCRYSGECQIADSEQKSELVTYNSRFAPRQPKLKSDLCMRLLTKST